MMIDIDKNSDKANPAIVIIIATVLVIIDMGIPLPVATHRRIKKSPTDPEEDPRVDSQAEAES